MKPSSLIWEGESKAELSTVT